MRSLIVFFLTWFLALPGASAVDLQSLCVGLSASGETSHSCCHQKILDCSIRKLVADCCQYQVPGIPASTPQAISPAPILELALTGSKLLTAEFSAFSFPFLRFVFLVPSATPPALYQLHRAYRI